MREIPLGKGRSAVVDDEDYQMLAAHRWYCGNGYARLFRGAGTVLMHRIILNAPQGVQVDHINHDRLDNRRANLRLCGPSENMRNRRTWKMTAAYPDAIRSRFKGVIYDGKMQGSVRSTPWSARIVVDGKHVKLGRFRSEVQAARCYDAAALAHHGEFACLNFSVA